MADNVDTVTGWMPQGTRVLTTAERQAFEILRTALPEHFLLAQVPLARFIKVPTRNSYAEWLRRVGHLCADLVVCDRNSLVIAVVEIRPSSAAVVDGRVVRRQQRLTRVLKAANIPLHVWNESALPAPSAVREAIVPTPPVPAPEAELLDLMTLPASLARSLTGRAPVTGPGPLTDDVAEPVSDEIVALHESPPSTWFDDLDSEATPLGDAAAPLPVAPAPRAAKDRAVR